MSNMPQRQKRTNIRRVRTGCLTCRERRIKCDELTPSCRQCLRSGRICKRGMRVRFQPFEGYSEVHGSGGSIGTHRARSCPEEIISSEQVFNDDVERGTASSRALSNPPSVLRQIEAQASNDDHPSPVVLRHSNGQQADERAIRLRLDPEVLTTARGIESEAERPPTTSSAVHDEQFGSLNEVPSDCSNNETGSNSTSNMPITSHDDNNDWTPISPSLTFNQLYSRNPGMSGSVNRFNEATDVSSPSMLSNSSVVGCPSETSLYQTDLTVRTHPRERDLTPALETILIQNYISQCASWCESTDTERHFSVKEIHHMMRCGPWRAAAMAISSRQRDLSDRTHPYSLSLELYQSAVKSLIEGVTTAKVETGVLAGCVLLTVYEMMTVTYSDWQRHLEGCAGIFRVNNWNGSTGGLVGCCFWAYARIDIWASFCNNRETIIPTDLWLDGSNSVLELASVDGDLHANIMIWLVAQAVNFTARRELKYSKVQEKSEWLRLWTSVQKWKAMDQAPSEPIYILEPGHHEKSASEEESPFPQIICVSDSSVIANVMYHTGCVLLLEQEEPEYREDLELYESCEDQLYYHAGRLCGIVQSNARPACLVNSVQPVWIGGRHLRTRSEKFGALELLSTIERSTGWKCGWRSECLRELWSIN